jgi:uncharacterized protein YrzB (UPF0473 family)
MRKKKDIPLVVLEALDPFVKSTSEKFVLVDPNNSLLKIIDTEKDSSFYFEVVNYTSEKGKTYLQLDFKPRNKCDISNYRMPIDHSVLATQFQQWLTLIEAYEKVQIYEDPILRKYQEEFCAEFTIVDEDANTSSYNLTTQLWISEYCDKVLLLLESNNTSETNDQIQILKSEITELKINQTKYTKKKVIELLTKIWARSRKIGLNLLKDIYIDVRRELIKQLVQSQLGA